MMSDYFKDCWTCPKNPETCNPQQDCPKHSEQEQPLVAKVRSLRGVGIVPDKREQEQPR